MKHAIGVMCLALLVGCAGRATTTTKAPANVGVPTTNGYGPWTFDMTRDRVAAVSKHAPYKPVRVTGGLETANGWFEGETKNVSFIFAEGGTIRRIQIWMYEGKDVEPAVVAWTRVFRYMKQHYGGVLLPQIQGDMEALTENALTGMFRETLTKLASAVATTDRPDGIEVEVKFEMNPKQPPTDKDVHAVLHYQSKYGFFVFLYVDAKKR